ncbi:MAG: molecular chaperone HtpG [Leptospiraceae bacterium]|nr:molecular chaperone HtpG [Leptospiraceae bacterium]
MEKGRLSVQTENLLPIIKKWLYSEKEIFLRELVSNAFDAITKLKKVALTETIRDEANTDYAIDIKIDRENNQLIIEDNGVGLTQDEIKRYITQIAFSGAEDFIKKYEESRDKNKAGIIGNFGLGFYSSFMISEKVEIDSLSWNPEAEAAYWSSDGGEEYEIGAGQRTSRGTTIRLHVEPDSRDLLEAGRINELIRRFCDFMPVPIRVDGAQVNREKAPWSESPQSLKKDDYNELYRHLYPFQGDPLFYVHLNVDYPFQLQGILYFPHLAHEMDLNRSNVKIFCKQVFVTDEAQEIIPKYLTVLQGVIDLPDLPLNVSRSYLQNEPQIRKIAQHIIKKVADRLNEEFKNNRENYERMWADISPFIKYAMMNDEKFYEQANGSLIFEVLTDGEQKKFVTIEDYLSQNKPKTGDKIYYVSDTRSQAGPLRLLQKQGIEVLQLTSMIDTHFMQWLESKGQDYHFTRVDAEISDHVVDKDAGSKILDAEGNDLSENLTGLFKKVIGNEQVTVRVEKFKDDHLPAMILLPEHMRRISEMSAMYDREGQLPRFPQQHTLVLNSGSELIRKLARPALITGTDGSAADSKQDLIARQIYNLALLAQGGIGPGELPDFLDNSFSVLDKL